MAQHRIGLSSALRYLVHVFYLVHVSVLFQPQLSGAHTLIKQKVGEAEF